MVNFEAAPVKERMTFPAGSYWVPMKQRRSRLILSLLEPQAPDSLIRWGFLNAVLEGRGGPGDFILEPIARRLMAERPDLRQEFEVKLAADPQFAADSRARLMWWYQRSNYNPGDTGRYPVARVWEKSW
jgi:hypothetical protein